MNFSPTHLTSVETDKGKINVMARMIAEESDGTKVFNLEYGFPPYSGAVMTSKSLEQGTIPHPAFGTVFIKKGEIEKVLNPLM